ncbi:penicillin amidase [Longispora fulva]|uniref:Penicillin amidase n=1 Tax=Longispora fulva TaxID=619741 RepID=A0A8J7GIQ2_9ACTN|nr:penicillin acylase family protein [Longispora fulva]MBG6137330.1 penicillin amidase [Longispora fulva]GIG61316.1 penicillin amidase [Longispora fulva]
MRKLRRVLLWSLVAVLVLVLAGAGYVFWTVRRPLAERSGDLRLAGLSAPVTVRWDAHGIPQVYATTSGDLFRAQGYLHATERFWEMDFRRHVTAGRLAELFGAGQVDTDKYLRTMGWRRVAEAEYAAATPETRGFLDAYAAGVNTWLADHDAGTASLEYSVLGLQNGDYVIEKWSPVDSLAWLKAMAWDLRGNMDDELTRAQLTAGGMDRARVEELYPAYPEARHAPIVPTAGTVADGRYTAEPPPPAPRSLIRDLSEGIEKVAAATRATGLDADGIGSNSWVVAGSRTKSGKPMLANDPHLSPSMPGIWYQMGLHCPSCGFDVAGFTFSGVPGVVIGHNGRIAWGFTNLDPDVTDLYLEKLDGDRYQVDGQWLDLDKRTEVLKVAGGDPVTITVRSTKHGPLMSDTSKEMATAAGVYGMALRWTALDPGHTIDALFAIDRASDWESFRTAASKFEVPSQNIVYADVDGNIGYQAPGRVPVRGKGDGRYPAPGWESDYDWKSFIPFAELPNEYNPARGYVVTANQEVIGAGYPRMLTHDWAFGYRSQRITDLLLASDKLDAAAIGRIQFDNRNGGAEAVVPKLLAVPGSSPARDLLKGWDFQQPADSAPAAFYNATWRALMAHTFDELGTEHAPNGGERYFEVMRSLLADPASPWWDDKRTPAVESQQDILAAAMADAERELTERFGKDPKAWRWGDLHTLTLTNQTFGKSGIGPIEWLFNRGPFPVAGGGGIPNATGWDAPDGYEVTAVPSMRMIVDMSDLDASRWVQLTGNSGHAFDEHYDDQFPLWQKGQDLPMRWNEATIRREAASTQVLRP